MNYTGKLYGKVGKVYIPLILTSEDVDRMEKQLAEAKHERAKLLAFVESLVDAAGPHTDINGSSVISEAYKVISEVKAPF